jgi:Zn-dependent M28 family amino/carboxypeptidase
VQVETVIPTYYNPFVNASQTSLAFGSWFGISPYGQGTEQGNAPVPSSFGSRFGVSQHGQVTHAAVPSSFGSWLGVPQHSQDMQQQNATQSFNDNLYQM